MNNFGKNIDLIVKWLFVLIGLSVFIFYLNDRIVNRRETLLTYNCEEVTGWEMLHEDGTRESVELPYSTGEDLSEYVFETKVPDNVQDASIVDIKVACSMDVYLDDELVYSIDRESYEVFGGLVKSIFVNFTVNANDAGKTIRVVRYNNQMRSNTFGTVRIGDRLGIFMNYFKKDALPYLLIFMLGIMSFLIVLFGVISYFVNKKMLNSTWLSLGILLCCLWCINDSDLYQFIFNDYIIDGLISYLLSPLMPVPFILYVNNLENNRHNSLHIICAGVCLVTEIIVGSLNFGQVMNFNVSMVYMNSVLGAVSLAVFVVFFIDAIKGYLKNLKYFIIGFFIFVLFELLEIVLLNAVPERHDGVLMIIGLYFLLFFGLWQQIDEINTTMKERQLAISENMAKNRFIASISHEIRTPVNSILGMNEMIIRECNDSKIAEYAAISNNSGNYLLSLINDILDFSQIKTGKLEIKEDEYQTKSMIHEMMDILEERAKDKGLSTKFNIMPQIPSKLIGDELRIKQIVMNLISNAVKYTQHGNVTLTFGTSPSDIEDICILRIVVSDTGIGIRKEDIEKLFDSYKRLDDAKNYGIQGTGLGLSIVKDLVDNMHGTVKVESTYGEGSSFNVMLPQKISDANPIGSIMQQEVIKYKPSGNKAIFFAPLANILVVDDNRINLMVVSKLLERNKLQIDYAISGKECIELCRKKKYNLILMDHMMPMMNGLETSTALRKDLTGKNNDTKIVILTANAVNGMKAVYDKYGFADYITKPINPQLLEKCVMDNLPDELVESPTD